MSVHQAILLEAQYLPPIAYVAKFLQYPRVLIEQHENYSKGTYRNRAHIATANGLQRLSIPLRKGKNEQQGIRAVQIAYQENWPARHWQAIRSAYGNSPFFEFYAHYFEPIFQQRFEFLFDLNWHVLQTILPLVGVEKKAELTTSFQTLPPDTILDFRNAIHPKVHRAKSDSNFQAPVYAQVFMEKTGFLPNLSILDLLFCTGPQAAFYLESAIQK